MTSRSTRGARLLSLRFIWPARVCGAVNRSSHWQERPTPSSSHRCRRCRRSGSTENRFLGRSSSWRRSSGKSSGKSSPPARTISAASALRPSSPSKSRASCVTRESGPSWSWPSSPESTRRCFSIMPPMPSCRCRGQRLVPRRYDGRIEVMWAESEPFDPRTWQMVGADVRLTPVAGNHNRCVTTQVASLGGSLARALREAQGSAAQRHGGSPAPRRLLRFRRASAQPVFGPEAAECRPGQAALAASHTKATAR